MSSGIVSITLGTAQFTLIIKNCLLSQFKDFFVSSLLLKVTYESLNTFDHLAIHLESKNAMPY